MPYSDNLYSMVDDDSDLEHIDDDLNQWGHPAQGSSQQQQQQHYHHPRQLSHIGQASRNVRQHNYEPDDQDQGLTDSHLYSPTDGYFTAPADGAAAFNVPRVPNVWVQDPSLEPGTTADSKAREADQERLANTDRSNTIPDEYAVDHRAAAASRNSLHTGYASTYSTPRPSRDSARHPTAAYHQPSSAYSPSTTTTSYTSYTARQPTYNDRSSIVTADAPPAYTPSPTSPLTRLSSASDYSTNYRTFQSTNIASNMGRREESQGLLANEPQSMGAPNDDLEDASPLWRNRVKRRLPHSILRHCKVALIALLLLLVTVGFITSLLSGMRDQREFDDGKDDPLKDTEPPKDPSPPGEPRMEYPDLDNGFQWRAEQLCPDVQIARRTETFDVSYASGKNLKLVQTTSHDNGEHYGDYVHVQGHVLFRRTGPSTPGPSVVLDVVVSDDRVNVHTAWDAEEQALLVTVPRGVSWSVAGVTRACVSITATVWVPEDAVLDRVVVEAVHLAIGLLDNLSLHVADTTKLSTVVGAITAAATGADAHDDNIIQIGAPASFRFYSRLIEATTTSAAIRGFWPLYDYLGLHSTSGTIKVAIDPKPSDKTYPKPATLSVKSLSGDVELREPVDDATSSSARAAESLIPPRDYRVDVHTTSGNIKAALAFSSTAALRSTSGAVRAQLLPVLDSSLAGLGKKSAWLETATTSGNVHLKVLEPLWVDTSTQTFVRTMSAPPFRCLYSEHRGVSADINLHYPASWEGDISLAATSGSLRVIGEDVKIIRSGHDWPGYNNRMLARKGEEGQGGNVRGKSTSGDIEVFVGGGE